MAESDAPRQLTLTDGRSVTVRWLRPTDADPLFGYFEALPAESKHFFGPHHFDRVTAELMCQSPPSHWRILVAESDGRIVAYFILSLEVGAEDLARMPSVEPATTACVAPSVLPEARGTGLAVAMMHRLFERARQEGRTHAVLMGGMSVTNERALAYYYKCGFTVIGEWGSDPLKYDMGVSLVR